jgi:hypothetical protein
MKPNSPRGQLPPDKLKVDQRVLIEALKQTRALAIFIQKLLGQPGGKM